MQQLQERPVSASTPLPGAVVYRPGGMIAGALVFVPVLAAAAAVGAYLIRRHPVPLWLSAAVLAWVLTLPFFWVALKTVRLDMGGIEAGRPWQTWRRIPWEAVRRVERRGPRVRVTARDYTRISFNPGLLHRGQDLRASLLLRVPTELLDDALRDEARGVVIVTSGRADAGQLPGMFRLRPHIALRLFALIVGFAALGAAPLAVIELPPTTGISIAAGCALVLVVAFRASLWLWQRVTLSDAGITVVGPLTGRSRGMKWSQIVLLEFTPKGSAIRVMGRENEGQVALPGPRVMRPLDATIYRAYLQRNLLDRRVLEAVRNWLLSARKRKDLKQKPR